MAPIFAVTYFLAVVPLFSNRTFWIARKTGVDIETISTLSCMNPVDIVKLAKGLEQPVVAPPSCGSCSSTCGHYDEGVGVVIYDRNGPRKSTLFSYCCDKCGAVSGPTTTALRRTKVEGACHKVSIHSASSGVFLPSRKPYQRADEVLGFSRDLLEEALNSIATIKTFEAFVLTYNRTSEFQAMREGTPAPGPMDVDAFRNAWFLCFAFEHHYPARHPRRGGSCLWPSPSLL